MTDKQNDAGVLSVLIQRLESQRLPRLLNIKSSVDNGERLSEHDLRFLQEVLADAKDVAPMIAKRLNPLWVKRVAVLGLTILGLSLVGLF